MKEATQLYKKRLESRKIEQRKAQRKNEDDPKKKTHKTKKKTENRQGFTDSPCYSVIIFSDS